ATDADVGLWAVVDAYLAEVLLRPVHELFDEAQRLVRGLGHPVVTRPLLADAAGGPGDVEAFVCDDGLRHDDRLAGATPDTQLGDKKRQVFGQRLQRRTVA